MAEYFDPATSTRRDDPCFWAMVLALAHQSSNHERIRLAVDNLRRLGMPIRLDLGRTRNWPKAVAK